MRYDRRVGYRWILTTPLVSMRLKRVLQNAGLLAVSQAVSSQSSRIRECFAVSRIRR